MEVQAINNSNFKAKNSFLNKSKNAITKQEKDYWKSLHYEAKAKLNYKKFETADRQLGVENINLHSIKGIFSLVALLSTMAYRKFQSFTYQTDSYSAFPNRFAEPDEYDTKETRHYKIKESYKHLIK